MILASARPASAQDCTPSSPALPVPSTLWPDTLRPAPTPRPNNQLPDNRDSTDYITTTIPGMDTGHELFESVAAYGDYLFVAYNAGIQVWSIKNDPDIPARLTARDGWKPGHWLDFPNMGEADSFLQDIAIAPFADGTLLVAVAALDPVGVSLWHFDPADNTLVQLYQGKHDHFQSVTAVAADDSVLVFAATRNEVMAFDANAALDVGPCVESLSAPSCGNVSRGAVAGIATSRFVAARTFDVGSTRHVMLASTDAAQHGAEVELYEIADPSSPTVADLRYSGISEMGMGVALFEKDQHAYLAVVDHTSGTATVNNQLKIHAIDECLEAPCTLDSPVWASDVFPSRAPTKTLRHSVDDRATADPSDDEHFLYMGFATTTLSGENAERLYHLRDLQPSPPNDGISELAAGGPTYRDNCSDEDVGYWGWYYPGNEDGLRNFSPRTGVFVRNRFYRAARGVFDIHIWTRTEVPEPPVDAGVDAGLPEAGPSEAGVPAVDGGADAKPLADAASSDAAAGPSGTPASDADGGCGCALVGRDKVASWLPAGLLLALLVSLWRKRNAPVARRGDR